MALLPLIVLMFHWGEILVVSRRRCPSCEIPLSHVRRAKKSHKQALVQKLFRSMPSRLARAANRSRKGPLYPSCYTFSSLLNDSYFEQRLDLCHSLQMFFESPFWGTVSPIRLREASLVFGVLQTSRSSLYPPHYPPPTTCFSVETPTR